jgi:hypothetical protein
VRAAGSEPSLHSAGITRRQALKAALAGVSLTLPIGIGLGRSAPAAAAPGPGACRKGCLFAADGTFNASATGCVATGAVSALTMPLTGFRVFVAGITRQLELVSCLDRAVLNHKVKTFDCNQPNCPNFDPYRDNSACKGCPPGKCCTAPGSVAGYTCCSVCCHKSGEGCDSTVTGCGA